jgi:hypothetical protein
MTLTGNGPHNFTLETFVSGVPSVSNVGPLGFGLRTDGKVLVTTATGTIRIYPNNANNQTVPTTIVPTRGQSNAQCIAQIQNGNTWKYYLSEDPAGKVVEIDEDGNDVVPAHSVNLMGALCIIPYPPAVVNSHTGHLFATSENFNDIFEIDPAPPVMTISTFKSNAGTNPDGIAFSADGSILYVACVNEFVVKGYQVSNGALVYTSPVMNPPLHPDGIALGVGTLTGYLYVNYNEGSVWEFVLPPGPNTGYEIASGGTRGDFVAVDPNYWSGGAFPSLLLTQTDRMMRLDPAGGGWFGPPTCSTDPVLCLTCFPSLCEPGAGGTLGCPCSNPPVNPARGCDNHGTRTGGARLDGSGNPSLLLDSVVLDARSENASALTVFWTGQNLMAPPGVVHGAGVRCVSGLHRLYSGSASMGAIRRPGVTDPSVSARSAAVGAPIVAGQTRYYFTIYRDPQAATPCSNSASTVNLTNTVSAMWTP